MYEAEKLALEIDSFDPEDTMGQCWNDTVLVHW